ncbi:hypothetical protein JOC85_003478 [Bacillus mesophilus]|uniref:Uncharacterized protein n=1 Tax=Bacillus mesophilus TaxID=1808955 RepID=A0A6M0QC34_9BACI|nr:hypothetical protein [Bacillus mesophilus]MBM7662668.1 hypothetical protein [Bacillus mesophilus]NEY73269.1 hypothetical protein [Bacillus mesophilus]
MEEDKVYVPVTVGIKKVMITVYGLVILAGTFINIMNHDGLQKWLSLIGFSSLYIIACAIIYAAIKSQRIILTKKGFILKQLGMTRHSISYSDIYEVKKGKMSGSPIMKIEANHKGNKKTYPVPFLPFEKDWNEILDHLESGCRRKVIGEMTLKREPGELRTWVNY